jgi:shikimate dehydrogenase
LRELGFEARGRLALVVGAGGAARAVAMRLAREGARIVIANRTPERAQRLARDVAHATGATEPTAIGLEEGEALSRGGAEAELLVNTTRVGMAPEQDAPPPVPAAILHPGLLVYDLVYNPIETVLLKEARRRGCRVLTGVKMLVYQGAAAFERWTGVWPPTDVMEAAVTAGSGE